MTHDEAVLLAAVIEAADGGCSTCVAGLCRRANKAFPEWTFEPGGPEHVDPFADEEAVREDWASHYQAVTVRASSDSPDKP